MSPAHPDVLRHIFRHLPENTQHGFSLPVLWLPQGSYWFVGSLGIFCNFWALSRLTIADASILNKMSPFFAIIMSIFILHELPGVFEWFCVAAAFAGTLFVVKPTAGLASIPAAI
ncbi:MAG: DMT family transporter, partial [Lachnospiraceae bacterium]|nr:DMT family transporter [Lachnospiraceae bacterium]